MDDVPRFRWDREGMMQARDDYAGFVRAEDYAALRAECDALRDELRAFAIEQTGSENNSVSYRCGCCLFVWVDEPERHDYGCLAAPREGEPG